MDRNAARKAYDEAFATLNAAKAAWDAYTGQRVITGPDGQPAPHPDAQPLIADLFRANARLNNARNAFQRADNEAIMDRANWAP